MLLLSGLVLAQAAPALTPDMLVGVGLLYLLTLGRTLTPERIKPQDDLTEEFEMSGYLSEVVVTADSPLVGKTVQTVFAGLKMDVDIVQIIRDDRPFPPPPRQQAVPRGRSPSGAPHACDLWGHRCPLGPVADPGTADQARRGRSPFEDGPGRS